MDLLCVVCMLASNQHCLLSFSHVLFFSKCIHAANVSIVNVLLVCCSLSLCVGPANEWCETEEGTHHGDPGQWRYRRRQGGLGQRAHGEGYPRQRHLQQRRNDRHNRCDQRERVQRCEI